MRSPGPRSPLGPTGRATSAGRDSYVIIRTNQKPQRVGPVQASTLGPVQVAAPTARRSGAAVRCRRSSGTLHQSPHPRVSRRESKHSHQPSSRRRSTAAVRAPSELGYARSVDAPKPPLLCPVCGEPIWHGDDMTLAHPMVDDGEGGQKPAPDLPPVPVHTPLLPALRGERGRGGRSGLTRIRRLQSRRGSRRGRPTPSRRQSRGSRSKVLRATPTPPGSCRCPAWKPNPRRAYVFGGHQEPSRGFLDIGEGWNSWARVGEADPLIPASSSKGSRRASRRLTGVRG